MRPAADSPARSPLDWEAGPLRLELDIASDGPVRVKRLAHADQEDDGTRPVGSALVELAADAEGHDGEGAAPQHRAYVTTGRLRYTGHRETEEPGGVRELAVEQADERTGLRVTTRIRHRPGTAVLHTYSDIRNDGPGPVRLRHVSSLNVPVTAGRMYRDLRVHTAYNSWVAELRWQTSTLEQIGLVDDGPAHSQGTTQTCHRIGAHGSRSSGTHLPVGGVSDRATGHAWAWQIEHNGPWVHSLDDLDGALHIRLAGPTEQEHAWTTLLAPGGSFRTAQVAVTACADGFEGALRALTVHRRALRRPHPDTEALPIVFNDYMNCLMGDPSREKLLPLVDAAARLGAEYFVIDAGWYADDDGWWSTVGEWRESAVRFPGGLGEITARIRESGMTPGLWLEPEVVGVRSPVADRLPREAFFQRDGERVVQRGRHQLDFRHPAARAHLDETVDRLVAEHGVGYFKLDHNINAAPGTDVDADSPGDGLLGHSRAFLGWLDGVLDRHPGLVLENCGSGGMRMDHAHLARMTLLSTSDQQDPVRYAPIAAAAPSAVTPEQGAVWAYPQPEYSPALNAFTMVSSLLGRVHLSGRIDLLSAEQGDAVARALGVYRAIRTRLRHALPSWPLGLPGWYDDWIALGLDDEQGMLLSVWRRGGDRSVELALPRLRRSDGGVTVEELYPGGSCSHRWEPDRGVLTVSLPDAPSACLLAVRAA
ncbi:glycoside hydrolase family 36 protein [Streptomyces cylindrosporus]|uniref:Alpha-galactosidase n=1 Tax=Streptomyces cylindrosporus TaxID=2927583 RepID=A0ABS9YP93_9ACTN|nr:glycoside hydrolase family 36 protein [Streptomyces cylindrosporus]MCI3278365.1 alpha-galactosidase [Streptomyces cylindrosporus]